MPSKVVVYVLTRIVILIVPRCLDYIWFSKSSLRPVAVLDTVGVPAGIESQFEKYHDKRL